MGIFDRIAKSLAYEESKQCFQTPHDGRVIAHVSKVGSSSGKVIGAELDLTTVDGHHVEVQLSAEMIHSLSAWLKVQEKKAI